MKAFKNHKFFEKKKQECRICPLKMIKSGALYLIYIVYFIFIIFNLENMTPTCISKKSGICKSTVYNFIKKLKETGQLEAYPRTGRPPVSTKREDNMLFR